jgi:hypothetical protein
MIRQKVIQETGSWEIRNGQPAFDPQAKALSVPIESERNSGLLL